MKIIFALALFLGTLQLQAAMPPKVLIIGTIEAISEKVVTIKTTSGAVKVPRKALRKQKNLTIGEEAKADVTPQGLKQLNG